MTIYLKDADEMHDNICLLLNRHALAAEESEYDRNVAVTAISSARIKVETILIEGTATHYGQQVLGLLKELHQFYNDPDGVYTNGRGVLGSLLTDIAHLVERNTGV